MRWRLLPLLLAAALAAALLGVVWLMTGLPAARGGAAVATALARELAGTGASHAVTGVLLGFRAYDTLLEVFVLLLAVLGTDAARAAHGAQAPHPQPGAARASVLGVLVNLTVPLVLLVAGFLLWIGTRAPGGAFQAAAVLAAAGVLLRLASVLAPLEFRQPLVRWALALGPALFLAVLLPGALPEMLLAVEAALTLSIALALLLLFTGPQR